MVWLKNLLWIKTWPQLCFIQGNTRFLSRLLASFPDLTTTLDPQLVKCFTKIQQAVPLVWFQLPDRFSLTEGLITTKFYLSTYLLTEVKITPVLLKPYGVLKMNLQMQTKNECCFISVIQPLNFIFPSEKLPYRI